MYVHRMLRPIVLGNRFPKLGYMFTSNNQYTFSGICGYHYELLQILRFMIRQTFYLGLSMIGIYVTAAKTLLIKSKGYRGEGGEIIFKAVAIVPDPPTQQQLKLLHNASKPEVTIPAYCRRMCQCTIG